jgi:hypothetical protein
MVRCDRHWMCVSGRCWTRPQPRRCLRPASITRPPGGVSRWVNAHGRFSLAGFSYFVGPARAGEPNKLRLRLFTTAITRLQAYAPS